MACNASGKETLCSQERLTGRVACLNDCSNQADLHLTFIDPI